jgi:hypothetical protein
MKKMIIKLYLILFLIANPFACSSFKDKELNKIKDDLYKNSKGDLFLRVNLVNKKEVFYVTVVYSDDFDNPDGLKKLNEVIDLETFKRLKKKKNLYVDKNYSYYLKIMYETATLSIITK